MNKKRFIISSFIILIFFITAAYYFFTALTLHSLPEKNIDKQKDYLKFYIYPKNSDSYRLFIYLNPHYRYLLVYNVNSYLLLSEDNKVEYLYKLPVKKQISILKDKILLEADILIQYNKQTAKDLFDSIGVLSFFNSESTNINKGRVYLDYKLYLSFMEGIKDKVIKQEIEFSLWHRFFSVLLGFYQQTSSFDLANKNIYNKLSINLSKKDFIRLVYFLAEYLDQLHLDYNRMNIDIYRYENDNEVILFNQGRHDQVKLTKKINQFITDDSLKYLERFPISLQVKNTTSVPRLAAKTAGIMRRKRCDVKEYLNSSIKMKNSLLIDRSGSPVKREYMKKITKLEDSILILDYRENFDFTLYLGEDYHVITR